MHELDFLFSIFIEQQVWKLSYNLQTLLQQCKSYVENSQRFIKEPLALSCQGFLRFWQWRTNLTIPVHSVLMSCVACFGALLDT